jgi:hypothetical protein
MKEYQQSEVSEHQCTRNFAIEKMYLTSYSEFKPKKLFCSLPK